MEEYIRAKYTSPNGNHVAITKIHTFTAGIKAVALVLMDGSKRREVKGVIIVFISTGHACT